MLTVRGCLVVAFVALLAAFIGLAALASGGSTPYGTNAAGERQTFYVATAIALIAGVVLLLARPTADAGEGGALGTALAGLVAALALTLPAVWAFGYPVTTPTDDVSGCGTISSPTKVFDDSVGDTRVTPTCADRLRRQKLLSAALAAPPVVIAAFTMAGGLRRNVQPAGLPASVRQR